MAATTTQNVTAILKEVYEPKLVSQLREKAVGWKRIQSSSKGVTQNVGGKYVDFPIEIGRNEGISFRAEGEQLGRPGHAEYDEVHVQLMYGYARGSLTGQVMDLAETNSQAFASALRRDQKSLRDAIKREQSRMFYGDRSGVLAGISDDAGVADLSFTVDDPYWISKNMDIDIREAAGTPLTNGLDRHVATVNRSTGVITVEASIGTFDATPGTHFVYRQGNQGKEPNGLKSIVAASGTIYGVNPAVNDYWVSPVTAVNSALSEGVMIRMVDDIDTEGGETSAIFTTKGVRRAYHQLLVQQRTFTNPKRFDGGLVGLGFFYGDREIPVVADSDLRETGVMYFLEESSFRFYHTGDWAIQDKDGSAFRWVQEYDEWQYMLKRYYELGCERRNANGKLTGITEN